MTLSIDAANSTPQAQKLNVLAHHDQYDQPHSGATLRVGNSQVHLSGEETIRLGRFLAGGHAAIEPVAEERALTVGD